MSDTNPDQEAVTPAGNGRRQRGRLATRAAVATVIAGGLAAGSYGIASAASGRVAAGTSASQALAAPSSPSRPSKPSVPWFGRSRIGGAHGFGRFGVRGGAFGAGPAGSVTAVTPTTITVKSLFGKTVIVTTNSKTVYRLGGSKVGRSALVVGEQVVLLPAGGGGGSTAKSSSLVAAVEIIQPHAFGKVAKISGSQLTVSGPGGLDVTVNTSPSTKYKEVGHSASASDVRVGTVVLATGTLSSGHNEIDAGTIQIVPATVAGQVTGVSGTSIKIRSFDGTIETVRTDSSTIFRKPGGKATIAAVAKGDFVEAFGTPGAGKTFAAMTVLVGPAFPGQIGGPSGLRSSRRLRRCWALPGRRRSQSSRRPRMAGRPEWADAAGRRILRRIVRRRIVRRRINDGLRSAAAGLRRRTAGTPPDTPR